MAAVCSEVLASESDNAEDASNKAAVIEHLVTIANRLPTVSSDLPLSITQLNAAQLKQINHAHIQESLLRVPGVSLHRGSGQEYLPAIRSPVLTGAGACGAFLIAQDGIPLRSAGFCNLNELFSAHTEQAQRIEVQRGPGSAAYGSNAVHGLVNVVTYDHNDLLAGINVRSVGLEFGENEYTRLKVSAFESIGSHSLGARVTATKDGGFRDDSGYDQQKINLFYRADLSKWNLTASLGYTNLNQETAGFITGLNAFQDEVVSRSNPNPEAFRDARSVMGWLRFEQKPGGDGRRGRWLITPYVRYNDMDFLQHFLPGDPLEENGHRSLGVQSSYYFQSGDQLVWQLGVDAEVTEGFLKQTQDQPTPGSAFLMETIPVGIHYDYEVDALLLAGFADMKWDINDEWQLSLGARLEHTQYDYDNLTLDGRTRDDGTECGFGGCRYSRPSDRKDQFTDISPKLGLGYQLAEGVLLYANYLYGFRAPQATELYRLQRAQQVSDLDSERIRSGEIGIKGRRQIKERSGQGLSELGNSLVYELAIYDMTKSNVIFRDADFFNRDNARTRHQGIELQLGYPIARSLDVSVNASYTRHRYARDPLIGGNDIDTAPRNFGSAVVGWNFLSDARAELEWVHVGSYFLDPENSRQYSGHDLANISVNWQLSSEWKVFARVNNLTDRRYADRADFTSFTQERYFPGESRSVYLGVEASW